jgi:hypothetical protein
VEAEILNIVAIASPFLTVGAAYGGVKVGLNGTKAAVRRIEQKLDSIEERTARNTTDIAVQRAMCGNIHAEPK